MILESKEFSSTPPRLQLVQITTKRGPHQGGRVHQIRPSAPDSVYGAYKRQ